MTGTITAHAADNSGFRPGDTVEVTFEWALENAPGRIEARLIWFTRGVGTVDVGLVESELVTPSARGEKRFRFRLPVAPYSFSGRLISLVWAVELVADDLAERWEFVLSPDGREIVLPQKIPMQDTTSFSIRARADKSVPV